MTQSTIHGVPDLIQAMIRVVNKAGPAGLSLADITYLWGVPFNKTIDNLINNKTAFISSSPDAQTCAASGPLVHFTPNLYRIS
jgi:hypothetical protein